MDHVKRLVVRLVRRREEDSPAAEIKREKGSPATEIISAAGELNEKGLEDFMKLHECGVSYAVVTIMGPQSSGKSTLLNHLFHTNFSEMDASIGRGKTTNGIWIAKAVEMEPCIMVMDVEGTDGQERGQDGTTFEKRSTLFALVVSDIFFINMWCSDIGRENAANRPLLKTIFEVMMQISVTRSHKATLHFIIHDKINETPIEILKNQLRTDIIKIWEIVPKTKDFKDSSLSTFFNVEVDALSHYKHERKQFNDEVIQLRKRVLSCISVAGDRGVVIPTSGLSLHMKKLWETIKENKELDLPTHKSTIVQEPDFVLVINEESLDLSELKEKIFEATGWNNSMWELQLTLQFISKPQWGAFDLCDERGMAALFKYSHFRPAINITLHAMDYGNYMLHADDDGGNETLHGGDNENDELDAAEIGSDPSGDESFSTDEEDEMESIPDPDSEIEERDAFVAEGSRGRYVYTDIGNYADPTDDDNFFGMPNMWSGDPNKIAAGLCFTSKDDVKQVVTLWSASRGVAYRLKKSNRKLWDVYCDTIHSSNSASSSQQSVPCQWRARAIPSVAAGGWILTHWVDRHNCSGSSSRQQGRNITSEMISHLIRCHLQQDLEFKVKSIKVIIREKYNVTVSYKKAWHGRRRALEYMYGDWESNINELPNHMDAVIRRNPNTRVVWKFEKGEKNEPRRTLRYLFWSFGACVQAFQHTFPVIMVDGTHLRGTYKGKLLVAVTKTANNRILPLAYALVDDETTHSWTWFLKHLRLNVLGDRPVCMISDRNAGLLAAWRTHSQRFHGAGWHRYCLRHICTNLMDKFHVQGIKGVCYQIGTSKSRSQYQRAWREMQNLSPSACEWLRQIPEHKWTLYRDGGRRYGNATTNVSESHNNTLKGTRFLPIRALVDSTLLKTASIFGNALGEIEQCDTFLATHHHTKFMKSRVEAARHIVAPTGAANQGYTVTADVRGRGVATFELSYRDRTCECGEWQANHFPCSHAIAVCLQRRDNPTDLVESFYTRSAWMQQYSGEFRSVTDNTELISVGWRLQPNHTRLVHHNVRGRRRTQRARMSMDHQNRRRTTSQMSCKRCNSDEHVTRKCPWSHPRSDRFPIDSMYNAHGERDSNDEDGVDEDEDED